MKPDLKKQLYALIDGCNDEYLLEEVKAVLESDKTGKEFWDELSEEDKESFQEGEEEHELGHLPTHHRLMHQLNEWKNK